jgi:hypothetical protein
MSTPLPMTHDCCCWQRSGTSGNGQTRNFFAAAHCVAANSWRAFARWQARKLEQRLVAFQPDSRWLHSI